MVASFYQTVSRDNNHCFRHGVDDAVRILFQRNYFILRVFYRLCHVFECYSKITDFIIRLYVDVYVKIPLTDTACSLLEFFYGTSHGS